MQRAPAVAHGSRQAMDEVTSGQVSSIEQQAQLQDLLLLQRVVQRINSILDLDVLLEQIVDDVKETFGYSRSGVLFLDETTNELVIAAVRGWTINYHVKGDRFKVGWGMIGHVAETGRTYYVPDVTKDPHYMVSEVSTRSEIDVPILSRGKLIGVFNAQHADVDAFPPHRIQLLESLAGHMGVAIENARMFERERRERERMTRELSEARTIQARLFPKHAPEIPGYRVTGLSKPCLEVGGDWYDYVPLADGRVGIVLGDVSGKGPGAALLMTSTRSILRVHAEHGAPPAAVLDEVNRVLTWDLPAARFVTMIYALLDPARHVLTFTNAGHARPALANLFGSHIIETPARTAIGRPPVELHRTPRRSRTGRLPLSLFRRRRGGSRSCR